MKKIDDLSKFISKYENTLNLLKHRSKVLERGSKSSKNVKNDQNIKNFQNAGGKQNFQSNQKQGQKSNGKFQGAKPKSQNYDNKKKGNFFKNKSKKPDSKNQAVCKRCNHFSHKTSACRAKYHKEGHILPILAENGQKGSLNAIGHVQSLENAYFQDNFDNFGEICVLHFLNNDENSVLHFLSAKDTEETENFESFESEISWSNESFRSFDEKFGSFDENFGSIQNYEFSENFGYSVGVMQTSTPLPDHPCKQIQKQCPNNGYQILYGLRELFSEKNELSNGFPDLTGVSALFYENDSVNDSVDIEQQDFVEVDNVWIEEWANNFVNPPDLIQPDFNLSSESGFQEEFSEFNQVNPQFL